MAVSTQMHTMHNSPRAPQKGAHPAPGRPQHPAPHPAAPHPHAQPSKKNQPPMKKKSHAWLYVLLALTVLGLAGVFWSMRSKGPAEPTPEALVQQIEDTALSAAPKANVYGGMIHSDHGSPPSITVAGIPSQACVSAGWRLARSGIVTINGTMPQRISAAILSELCTQDSGNTLTWSPKGE